MEIRLVPRGDDKWRYIVREKRTGALAFVDTQSGKKVSKEDLAAAIEYVQGKTELLPAG